MIICAAPDYWPGIALLIASTPWVRTIAAPFAVRTLDVCCPAGEGGREIVDHQVVLSLCVNDEEMEIQAVLAGHVIGQLTAIAAASHIRSGRPVPLLTEHVVEHASAFIYYGSRAAQPLRVRAFIDLAVKRLVGEPALVLSRQELAAAEASGRAAAQ